jgi:hypothetical protein
MANHKRTNFFGHIAADPLQLCRQSYALCDSDFPSSLQLIFIVKRVIDSVDERTLMFWTVRRFMLLSSDNILRFGRRLYLSGVDR